MMGIFRRSFSALLGRQSDSIPAVCYPTCNNAYIEAQKLGENSTLCASNSLFEVDYAACVSCLTANNYNQAQLSNVTLEFKPFIAFCAAQPTGSEVSISTQLSQAKSSLLAQASSLGLTLGSTMQVTQTVFSIQTVTASQLSTSSNPFTSSPPITQSKSANQHWIAGAVVGLLFVVALGVLAFWIWMRKKRRSTVLANKRRSDEEKKDVMMKAQLHGDSMPRHELEGHATTELYNEPVLELPVLEPVGSELSAKKQVFIRRKPVGGFT